MVSVGDYWSVCRMLCLAKVTACGVEMLTYDHTRSFDTLVIQDEAMVII